MKSRIAILLGTGMLVLAGCGKATVDTSQQSNSKIVDPLGMGRDLRRQINEDLLGKWIGKWDDEFAVAFVIRAPREEYDVDYKWQEHPRQPFAKRQSRHEPQGATLSMDSIVITVDENDKTKAIAQGDFDPPRTAHLVKVDVREQILSAAWVIKELRRRQAEPTGEVPKRDPNDPLTGMWIGAWEDSWPVTFTITTHGDHYRVLYRWQEGIPVFDRREFEGKADGKSIISPVAKITLDEEQDGRATAVSQSGQPVTAKLFRIEEMDEHVVTEEYVADEFERRRRSVQPTKPHEFIALAYEYRNEDPPRQLSYLKEGLTKFPESIDLLLEATSVYSLRASGWRGQTYSLGVEASRKKAAPFARKAAVHARQAVALGEPLDFAQRRIFSHAIVQEACSFAVSGDVKAACLSLREALDLGFFQSEALEAAEDLAGLTGNPEFEAILQEARSLIEPNPGEDYDLKPHPADAVEFQGHWYKLIPENCDWLKAQAQCRELGGYLACVNNAEEDEFFKSQWPDSHLWLGGIRQSDQTWQWMTGEPVDYANWHPGQPSGYSEVPYFRIITDEQGLWYGVSIDAANTPRFVCEWEE